jgi:hypothetical protein
VSRPAGSLSITGKLRLASRVLASFVVVEIGLHRRTLPDLVRRLSGSRAAHSERLPPRRLGLIVYRILHVGPIRARCLVNALVLYRLLRQQGDAAQLVIGLRDHPDSKDAHAWVEVDGVDVGPPPGRGPHDEFGRFG